MENDRPSAGLRVLVCMILVFLVVPVFVAVPMAFSSGRTLGFPPPGFSLQHFARLLSWEGGGPTPWPSAIFNSLSVGFVSAALAVALGTPAAVGLRRLRGAARGGLTLFFVLPMVTPIIVSSIASAIRGQIKKGVFISAHLKAGAADVRSTNMSASEKRAFVDAVREAGGFDVMFESTPPHFHLQLD